MRNYVLLVFFSSKHKKASYRAWGRVFIPRSSRPAWATQWNTVSIDGWTDRRTDGWMDLLNTVTTPWNYNKGSDALAFTRIGFIIGSYHSLQAHQPFQNLHFLLILFWMLWPLCGYLGVDDSFLASVGSQGDVFKQNRIKDWWEVGTEPIEVCKVWAGL